MSTNLFNDRRPSDIEEKAHAEAMRHFAEHLQQFPASQDAVAQLERNLTKTALAVDTAASRPPLGGNPILTDDGIQWNKGAYLFDNVFVCHRSSATGTEYAVVEHFPANGRNEIWTTGWNVLEMLRAFAREERQALKTWTDDMAAQVREFLAEKYPGQDMGRVADGFMRRFSHPISPLQKIDSSRQQKHKRGIGV
jgi:hypothetical protein